MIKRFFIFVFLCIVSLIFFSGHSVAGDDLSRPAITIINPIRGNGLGHGSEDLLASLQLQWQLTKEAGVNATWLFQYGALENAGMTGYAKQEMKDQEFGLWFEIDRNYADKSDVRFRGQGEWYFSDGLLLSSYDKSERRMIIDAAFRKFREIFGYYPKTVGAWWIGGDSLTYMQQKYGITGALRAADQFDLDTYSIWGTPWNIPYLSSRENEGLPASSFEESAKVVILQWAIRDPLKGYADATYSLQDYPVKGYTGDYADYLASIYLSKPYGNFVMGLENGGALDAFRQSYTNRITKAKEIQDSGRADIVLARDYAGRFLSQKKVFAGRTYFLSTDYGSADQSFLYISENYRAMIHKTKDTVSLVDLRNYSDKTTEDFDVLPNSQAVLRINEPGIIDSMRFPDQSLVIKTATESLTLKETGSDIELLAGNKTVARFTPEKCTLYPEDNPEKTYTFSPAKPPSNPLYGMYVLCVLYFGVVCIYRKNVRKSLTDILPLLIPLCLATPFITGNSVFLFDRKETVVLYTLFSLNIPSVLLTVYMSKILPLLTLLILHYLCVLRFPGKKTTYLYWLYYFLVTFLYFRVPYFPLDKNTGIYAVVALAGIAVVMYGGALYIFIRNRTKAMFMRCFCIPLIILTALGITVVISRSRLALTGYEIDALQIMKSQNKSVLYVEQVDYSIRPIYKAVKPILYTDSILGQIITGRNWETVMRPENNILNISGYDNKIIVIPRYLGSDISGHETTTLQLIKIFDNAQIAIFEKM